MICLGFFALKEDIRNFPGNRNKIKGIKKDDNKLISVSFIR
jgi:hypothetical protein